MTRTGNDNPRDPTLASLLRAAADGELSPGQRRELDAHLRANPGDQTRIDFEQRLRGAVGRTMEAPRAPDALRGRIAALAEQPESLPEHLSEQTRRPMYWSRARSHLAAVAALLVLVFGAWQLSHILSPGPGPSQEAYSVQLAGFLGREHSRCSRDPEAAARKFHVRDVQDLPVLARDWVGQPVNLEELFVSPVEFMGAGRCGVPSKGKSIHVRVAVPRPDGPGSCRVSLFIKQDGGELPMEDGVTYRLTPPASEESAKEFIVWRCGSLVYFLVCDDADSAQRAWTHAGLPPPARSF
jgi:hypothetical protein